MYIKIEKMLASKPNVKWIEVMSQKGFPIVSSDLLSSVEKIVKDLNLDVRHQIS